MATWIDFKELREKLRLIDVLNHYGIQLKVRGERATGLCPLPTHPQRTDGKRRTASFSAHLGKGIWRCFGCNVGGNSVDLAVRMQRLNPDDPAQFRQAALKLAEIFAIRCSGNKNAANSADRSATPAESKKHAVEPREHKQTDRCDGATKEVVINAPIGFELKHLDPTHPYLLGRGFTPETIQYFGLGFCSKGLMKDRVAIPLHGIDGRLISYVGRLVDDTLIDDDQPKYLFPPPRERDGKLYEFQKSLIVYRGFEYLGGVSDLVVVEGFASVWWLRQHNQYPAVALMGSSCSPEQAEMICRIVKADGRVWIVPDGDDGGVRCAESLLIQISPQRFTRWVKLRCGRQPTDLALAELQETFCE